MALGKTPFGDLRRSWALVLFGLLVAAIGMYVSWVPGHLTDFSHQFVGVVLFFGGIFLLLQLYLSESKARTWLAIGGLLKQLTIACYPCLCVNRPRGRSDPFPWTLSRNANGVPPCLLRAELFLPRLVH